MAQNNGEKGLWIIGSLFAMVGLGAAGAAVAIRKEPKLIEVAAVLVIGAMIGAGAQYLLDFIMPIGWAKWPAISVMVVAWLVGYQVITAPEPTPEEVMAAMQQSGQKGPSPAPSGDPFEDGPDMGSGEFGYDPEAFKDGR